MFNKNIFAVLALLGSLVSGNVFAKNEGLALGLHYNHNDMGIESASSGGVTRKPPKDFKDQVKNDANGGSLGLKYYFNLSDVVIAPTIFVDYLGNEKRSDTGFSTTYRYGGGLDLGFNVNEKFMLYVAGGLVNTKYELKNRGKVFESDFSDSMYYGAGLNFKLSKNIHLNLEYNVSDVDMVYHEADTSNNFKVKVLKVGIIYGF